VRLSQSRLHNSSEYRASCRPWRPGLGFGLILLASTLFTSTTPYPGSLVAILVHGAALIIAGGVSAPELEAEWLLGRQPFAGMGKRSYSLFLWHWPILIVAAEQARRSTLSTEENVLLIVLLALPLSHFT
jgi:peptidoglycan/LPS O-acetylase OafA/YrhL